MYARVSGVGNGFGMVSEVVEKFQQQMSAGTHAEHGFTTAETKGLVSCMVWYSVVWCVVVWCGMVWCGACGMV